MKQVFLISLLLSFAQFNVITSQSLRAYERAGDHAFQNKDYGSAINYYGDVLKRRDGDIAIWWKYGETARLFNAYPEAERSYQKVAEDTRHYKKHPLVDYRLGEVKKSQGEYDLAIQYFEKFIEEKPKTDPAFFDKAQNEIEACRTAQAIAASPAMVDVKALGKEVNSPWYDFAPSIVGDTLFYSSYRFDKRSEKGKNKHKLSKVMISVNGGRGREPGRGFPATDTAHIAHTAFSPDGHYVFFTICKDLNARDKRCELWMTVIDRRNRWLPPVRLPEPINMPGYTTSQPNIGYDQEAEGPVLWFVSDRPGGKGKMDLWKVPLDTNFFCACNLPLPGKKITYLPSFERPVNVEELNTPENEATPFFFAPQQKLYFSSEGWPGLGGMDIFATTKEGGHFAAPENLGAGFNTSYNDLYMVLSKDGTHGYLSSNRPGSLFLDERNKACCNDLFSFTMPEVRNTQPQQPPPGALDTVAVPKLVKKDPALVATAEHLPEIPKPELADFKGLPLYFDNDEPDKRTHSTATKQSYEETALAYLDRQAEYREKFSKGLKDKQADDAENAIDNFFDLEIRAGAERLNQLCDLMLQHLQQGESLEVQLKGFTSPRAQSDYNLQLAKRRISSVRNHFENYENGALKPFLESGKLKIVELSFGETTARSSVSDRLSDERNSIYHPDAARERRVEIVEVLSR